MKYNAAVLRSRRIQKQISERSLSALHRGHTLSEHGQPAHHRAAQGTGGCQHWAARPHQEPVTHAKESAHGTNVPRDRHHRYPEPVASQNKAKTSAAAGRTDVDKVSRVSGRTQRTVTPHVLMTERTESDKTLVKWSSGVNATGPVTSAVGIAPYPEDAPKLLLACESSADNIEIYATLRRNRHQKTVQQHSADASSNVRQRSSHSGISNPADSVSRSAYDKAYAESRRARRQDKTPLPPDDSMSHLKISWSVIDSCLCAFVSRL